jgi:hypothetical protein
LRAIPARGGRPGCHLGDLVGSAADEDRSPDRDSDGDPDLASLIPAAMPLFSFGTTLTATSAITGFSSPVPAPSPRKPPRSMAHSSPAPMPDISSRPTPAAPSAVLSITRAGTRDRSAPAIGANTKLAIVMGRYRSPASSGEYPR